MNGISKFLESILNCVSGVPFDVWVIIDLCAFGGIFVITLLAGVFSRRIRYADKRAFFHLLNAFSAVTLALLCTRFSAPQALAFAAIFWCIGYLMYGLLCVLSKRRERHFERTGAGSPVLTARTGVANSAPVSPVVPAAQSTVRLDHALSVADKLLLKTLGRGDRQEIEKIKTALTVLKVKGELTPQDGEALNDMFNALLKLMAKYDV